MSRSWNIIPHPQIKFSFFPSTCSAVPCHTGHCYSMVEVFRQWMAEHVTGNGLCWSTWERKAPVTLQHGDRGGNRPCTDSTKDNLRTAGFQPEYTNLKAFPLDSSPISLLSVATHCTDLWSQSLTFFFFFESKWESRWDTGTEADFWPQRLAREAEVLRLKSVLGHYQDITYSTAIHRLSHRFSTRNEGWSDT